MDKLTVYYELTTSCPLNCPICHVPETLRHVQPLTRNSVDVMLDLMLLKEKLQARNVVFSGGEPTLHPELEEIIAFTKKLGLNPTIISNGFYPEKLLEISSQAEIWISIDYYGKLHDKKRGMKGLWKNYKLIEDIANIRATLLRNNLEHVKKLIWQAAENQKKITIVPLKGKSRKLAPTPQQLQKLLLYIFKQGYEKRAVIDAPSAKMFLLTKHPKLQNETSTLCPACQTVIRINPKGYVTPCPFLKTKICHITDPETKQKINKTRQKIKETYTGKCRNCKHRKVCGGCKASLNLECFLTDTTK